MNTQTPNSIGELLQLARERANLTTTDVANELRLTVTVIENIENNKLDCAAPTFMRGYIRSYAKHVNISDHYITEILVSCGLTETDHKQANPEPEVATKSTKAKYSANKIAIYVAIIAVLIALSFTWHHQTFNQEQTTNVKAVKAQKPAAIATHTPPQVKKTIQQNQPTINSEPPVSNALIAAALPEQGITSVTEKEMTRE